MHGTTHDFSASQAGSHGHQKGLLYNSGCLSDKHAQVSLVIVAQLPLTAAAWCASWALLLLCLLPLQPPFVAFLTLGHSKPRV